MQPNSNRFDFCLVGFEKCLDEAQKLATHCTVDQSTTPANLRGSLLLGVSGFDFLVHELVRIEIIECISNDIEVLGIDIPISIAIKLEKHGSQELELFIRNRNSYRAFVAPKNVKEAFKPIVPNVWKLLADNSEFAEFDTKKQIQKIWEWRNRIAHEGDYIPSNSSFEKWPIYKSDVLEKLIFLLAVGRKLTTVLASRHD